MGSHKGDNSPERDRDRKHSSSTSKSRGGDDTNRGSSRRREDRDRNRSADDDDRKHRNERDRDSNYDDKDDDDGAKNNKDKKSNDKDRRESRRGEKEDDRRGDKDKDRKDDRKSSSNSNKDAKKRRHSSDDSGDESDEGEDRRRRRRRHHRSKSSSKKKSSRRRHHREDDKRKKRKRKKKSYSSSESSSSSSDSSSSESESDNDKRTTKKVVNKKLLEKLAARGETLDEWRARKSEKRATRISAKFGYTAEDNPFNDANLHETFTWKKKEEKAALTKDDKPGGGDNNNKADHIFDEIEKVRQRRKDRELQFEEMERIRAEESRMKELENYDEWARKEEEFHLSQQRQRSAIRLVEGREKPIDVLAKNLLLFGLSEEDRNSRGSVKYQERYNALNALESVEAELEEPQNLLKVLKTNELEELLVDITAFQSLEREASAGQAGLQDDNTNAVLKYWEALKIVAKDEVKYLKTGGSDGSHAKMVLDVQNIFEGQSFSALTTMQGEVEQKLRDNATSGAGFGAEESQDSDYWRIVLEQLIVYLAKMELSELHAKMLVCQLEKLELKKEELSKKAPGENNGDTNEENQQGGAGGEGENNGQMVPKNVAPDFGNLEEELGLTDEIDINSQSYSWQDKYRPRKPRYFNRVKTGYDWNKYNQTHYDHDNPPPKTVQGYKFNIFYPDLIDPTKTPQFFLEQADSGEFCILRFHAGPPYEDVAFKIINREWNRSRKRGFRCTFERGVLSLYFNFATHWYRR